MPFVFTCTYHQTRPTWEKHLVNQDTNSCPSQSSHVPQEVLPTKGGKNIHSCVDACRWVPLCSNMLDFKLRFIHCSQNHTRISHVLHTSFKIGLAKLKGFHWCCLFGLSGTESISFLGFNLEDQQPSTPHRK